MNRVIKFNAWLPELQYMLEDVAIGHGSIGVPFIDEPEDEFYQFLKSKGFITDDDENLPEYLYASPEDWCSIIDEKHYVLLQYIGLKGYVGEYENRHQNEVELFEGDIVEAMSEGSKGTFVIKLRQEGAPMWLLYPNFQHRKHWNIHASDIGRKPGDYFDDLKRIGNIYQNPELIQL